MKSLCFLAAFFQITSLWAGQSAEIRPVELPSPAAPVAADAEIRLIPNQDLSNLEGIEAADASTEQGSAKSALGEVAGYHQSLERGDFLASAEKLYNNAAAASPPAESPVPCEPDLAHESKNSLKLAKSDFPSAKAAPAVETDAETARLKALQAQYAPVELKADLSNFPENEKKALARIVEAAQIMDPIFLRQVWAGNEKMLEDLRKDDSPLGQARLKYFLQNKGPWDRIDHNKPFIPGAGEKPKQANFYPADATKDEVNRWIESLPADQKAQATGFFSVVRRGPDGKFQLVPFSKEYRAELEKAAGLLRQAAELTKQPTLKTFLTKRADAFLSDNYYDSDVAWMELNSSIEPTIGPYENYEDDWFNYKAAFEAFITVLDPAGTSDLREFSEQLQWLEDRLPIDPKYRNPKLGALTPIRVVNQIYASGDAARGVATAAHNLPNDEKVLAEKGSKRTMLKNVQEAKFDMVLIPISKVALAQADQKFVDFNPFFTHILMHELMHGLGPHDLVLPSGEKTSVRKALKELSGAMEEAKADISGLWALQKLIDKGVLDKKLEETMYVTYLASGFRTIRFGISEAHGKGMAMQLNYLMDRGAVIVAKDGTFAVNKSKVKGAVEALTRDIMTIQAHGDYEGAKAMLDTLGTVRPSVQTVINRLKDVPVDIEPQHTTAIELIARYGAK